MCSYDPVAGPAVLCVDQGQPLFTESKFTLDTKSTFHTYTWVTNEILSYVYSTN